jgi:hypothetical protein
MRHQPLTPTLLLLLLLRFGESGNGPGGKSAISLVGGGGSALLGAPMEPPPAWKGLGLQDRPPLPATMVRTPWQVGRFHTFHLRGLKWEGKMGAWVQG